MSGESTRRRVLLNARRIVEQTGAAEAALRKDFLVPRRLRWLLSTHGGQPELVQIIGRDASVRQCACRKSETELSTDDSQAPVFEEMNQNREQCLSGSQNVGSEGVIGTKKSTA